MSVFTYTVLSAKWICEFTSLLCVRVTLQTTEKQVHRLTGTKKRFLHFMQLCGYMIFFIRLRTQAEVCVLACMICLQVTDSHLTDTDQFDQPDRLDRDGAIWPLWPIGHGHNTYINVKKMQFNHALTTTCID